jgi:hypothetical protein
MINELVTYLLGQLIQLQVQLVMRLNLTIHLAFSKSFSVSLPCCSMSHLLLFWELQLDIDFFRVDF